jgi:hypothetical protein
MKNRRGGGQGAYLKSKDYAKQTGNAHWTIGKRAPGILLADYAMCMKDGPGPLFNPAFYPAGSLKSIAPKQSMLNCPPIPGDLCE